MSPAIGGQRPDLRHQIGADDLGFGPGPCAHDLDDALLHLIDPCEQQIADGACSGLSRPVPTVVRVDGLCLMDPEAVPTGVLAQELQGSCRSRRDSELRLRARGLSPA